MKRALAVSTDQASLHGLRTALITAGFESVTESVTFDGFDMQTQFVLLDAVTEDMIRRCVQEDFLTSRPFGVGVLLLAQPRLLSGFEQQLVSSGIFVLYKPVEPALLVQAVQFVCGAMDTVSGLYSQNRRLQEKMDSMKIINRAKFCLMQYLNFTEPQAHRHIQKQAMNMRISPREAAETILKMYET